MSPAVNRPLIHGSHHPEVFVRPRCCCCCCLSPSPFRISRTPFLLFLSFTLRRSLFFSLVPWLGWTSTSFGERERERERERKRLKLRIRIYLRQERNRGRDELNNLRPLCRRGIIYFVVHSRYIANYRELKFGTRFRIEDDENLFRGKRIVRGLKIRR